MCHIEQLLLDREKKIARTELLTQQIRQRIAADPVPAPPDQQQPGFAHFAGILNDDDFVVDVERFVDLVHCHAVLRAEAQMLQLQVLDISRSASERCIQTVVALRSKDVGSLQADIYLFLRALMRQHGSARLRKDHLSGIDIGRFEQGVHARKLLEAFETCAANLLTVQDHARYPDRSLLTHALVEGNQLLGTLLCEMGIDVNWADAAGRRPLHQAAQYGLAQAARVLLEHDADRSATDSSGSAAAQVAHGMGYPYLARRLDGGASGTPLNAHAGRTPKLAEAVGEQRSGRCFGPRHRG